MRYFNHLIIDDFLPQGFHDSLLQHALENREKFAPSRIANGADSNGKIDANFRISWRCEAGLGQYKKPFKEAIRSRLAELIHHLGLQAFGRPKLETELTAHRNGGFYRTHIDTTAGPTARRPSRNRVISTVYYFHTQPKGFSGGELGLAPLGNGSAILIEPRDNRLVAFPSFAPHEVRPIACANDDFAFARFAVNCWLHRENTVENCSDSSNISIGDNA